MFKTFLDVCIDVYMLSCCHSAELSGKYVIRMMVCIDVYIVVIGERCPATCVLRTMLYRDV